jgi:hypothetical protein
MLISIYMLICHPLVRTNLISQEPLILLDISELAFITGLVVIQMISLCQLKLNMRSEWSNKLKMNTLQ